MTSNLVIFQYSFKNAVVYGRYFSYEDFMSLGNGVGTDTGDVKLYGKNQEDPSCVIFLARMVQVPKRNHA